MFGRKQREIENLQYRVFNLRMRVRVLEERLCPYGEHEWKEIAREYDCDEVGTGEPAKTGWKISQCRRCGKLKDEW